MTDAPFGLVVCGGNSSRMGIDKSMLVYHDEPQCYFLHRILQPFCEQVFISCNARQVNQFEAGYQLIPDNPLFSNIGPMAALLSAFELNPNQHFLVIGCDYPFLEAGDVSTFLNTIKKESLASAFFNREAKVYEPLLAYYKSQSAITLLEMHKQNKHSLQHFLAENDAEKFYPGNDRCMQSVDTMEAYFKAKAEMK